MSASATAKGFEFSDSKDNAPNTVTGVLPVETFLVQYMDGSSKKAVRLVFRLKESKAVFILQERINGQFTATAATDWFNKAVSKKIDDAPKLAESV